MATEDTTKQPQEPPKKQEICIVSRSGLFYWWPIWAIGFIMSAITFWSGYDMVAVPDGTTIYKNVQEDVVIKYREGNATTETDPLKNKTFIAVGGKTSDNIQDKPGPSISPSHSPGVIFSIALLLVIGITNIHMRGLWSVIVIVVLVSLIIILSLIPEAWNMIVEQLFFLDIRINAGGYFFISSVLFVLWLIVYFLFDPRTYMIFTPGSFRVHLEIGEGETAYDTRGMTMQKVRSDFFRHWILGLGSGDLIVKTTGANAHEFYLPNVLFVSRKVKIIEEMLRVGIVITREGQSNN